MTFARSRNKLFNSDAIIVSSIFILALALRLFMIGSKSLWGDELYAAGLMQSSISDLILGSFKSSPHPPLAFLFPRLVVSLFGPSEAALRSVPAFMSALAAVPLFFFIKNAIGKMPALVSSLLWALAPYSLSLGQEGWLYATLACFGFSFIYVAQLTWSSNNRAAFFLVPLGLAGMLIQHLFFLFLAAGFLLFFAVPTEKRVSFRKFIVLGILMAIVYAPFVSPAFKQASLRAERLENANVSNPIGTRFQQRVPTVFARLIPGGVAGELSASMFEISITSFIYIACFLSVIFSLILMFFDRKLSIPLRLWLLGILFIPLLLFLKEDPTVRHLSILWLPFAVSVASLYRRYKPASFSLLLLASVLLFPYYRLDTFPYHRSNWRRAVEIVQTNRSADQKVVILAGQNGGVAWDYYAGAGTDRVAIGGETPYEIQATRSTMNPLSVVDSLLEEGNQVWVIHDVWGGPAGGEIAPHYNILRHERPSAHIEVLLFGN